MELSNMSTETYLETEPATEEFYPYRAISKAAVVSLAFGVMSLSVLLSPVLLFLPVVSIVFGLIALSNIRRYPDELTGRSAAAVATVLSGFLLIGGVVLHAYIYATEVPPGHVRISFQDLQPTDDAPHLPVSPRALELNGKKVFVKGYVYPDGQQYNITDFILVRDMGTCCFGGQPPLTHMIEVSLRGPNGIEYALRKRKLAGTLTVNTRLKPVPGLGGVYFRLDADYVR
jgi:hypothetical protein